MATALRGFENLELVPTGKMLLRMSACICVSVSLVACGSNRNSSSGPKADINNKTKFSSKAYGVAASKRVTTSKRVKRGGGYVSLGKPYKIKGKWYTPKDQPGYNRVGTASWYGPNFHGRITANGEIYDQYSLSAAHPTFPLPSYARVTNTKNGHSAIVRVNDRGPYAHNRLIDLSSRTADILDFKQAGTAKVRVEYIGRAPLHGRDVAYLEKSIRGPRNRRGLTLPGLTPRVAEPTIMVAKAEPVNPLPKSVTPPAQVPLSALVSGGATPSINGSLVRPQNTAAQVLQKNVKSPTAVPIGKPFQLPGIAANSYAEARISTAHNVGTPFKTVLKQRYLWKGN